VKTDHNLNKNRPTGLAGALASPQLIALLLVAVTLALFGPAAGFDATNCDDPDYFTSNVTSAPVSPGAMSSGRSVNLTSPTGIRSHGSR